MTISFEKFLFLSFYLIHTNLAQNVTLNSNETVAFNAFVKTYNRTYDSEEQFRRKMIFIHNLRHIQEHNANPNKTYYMTLNQFADLPFPFKKANSSSYRVQNMPRTQHIELPLNKSLVQMLSKDVDWRRKGAIGEVRDQLICGSCWAFGLTQTLASYIYLKSRILPVLSVQQLTSCVLNPHHCGGTGGCNGSTSIVGFTYISLYGLALERDYPYISGHSRKDEECTFRNNKEQTLAKISGFKILPSNDMIAALQHLDRVGPLIASVDASLFYLYKSGIHEGCDFKKNIMINHEVQLVGYGNDSVYGSYWLIRNSWGKNWGEEGYIRLKRYSEIKCGYDFTPSIGVGCPMDLPQFVCGNCGILFQLTYPIGARLENASNPTSST